MIATGDIAGVICIFKGNEHGIPGNGKASVRATLRSAGEISCLVFSSFNNGIYDGLSQVNSSPRSSVETLAIGTSLGSIVVLDTSTGKPVFRQERGHSDRVNCIAFFRHHELLSGGDDCLLNIWDMSTNSKKCSQSFDHAKEITCIMVHKQVIITGATGILLCYKLHTHHTYFNIIIFLYRWHHKSMGNWYWNF